MADHPDLLIAIPSLSRPAAERWTVSMHRGNPWRVVFRHFIAGKLDLDHTAHWDGHWSAALPDTVPAQLAAKAHRILRHRAGRPGAPEPTPSERLGSIRRHLAATAAVKAGRSRRLVGA